MNDEDDVDRRLEEFNKKKVAPASPNQPKSANGCLTVLIGTAALFIAIFSVIVGIAVLGNNKNTKSSNNFTEKSSKNINKTSITIKKYKKKNICENKKLIEYLKNRAESADKRIIGASIKSVKNWHSDDVVALTTKSQIECLSAVKVKVAKSKFLYKEYYFEQNVPLYFPRGIISAMQVGHVKIVNGSEKLVKSGHTPFYHEVKKILLRKMENDESAFCDKKTIIDGLTDAMPALIKKRFNIYLESFGITPDQSSDFVASASPTKPVIACVYKLKYVYNETPNGNYRTIRRGKFNITVYNYYFSRGVEKVEISKPLF